MKSQLSEFSVRIKNPGRERHFVIVMAILFMFAFVAAWIIDPLYLIPLLAATPFLIAWGTKPSAPLLLIAATFPFTSIELTAGALNVPIADAIAFIAIIAWVFRMLYLRVVDGKRIHEYDFPAWPAAVAFFAVAAISAAATVDSAIAFKYLARPLVFFYLAFIFLPANTIRTREYLERLFAVVTGLGVVVALYGLVGFIVAPASTFLDRRVVPIDILGVNPLAGNHNLIANVLIIAIPMGMYLLLRSSERSASDAAQKLLFLGVLTMVAATALTFSRTAWLTLLVQLVLLLLFQYRHHMWRIIRYTGVAVLVALPLIGYMTFFSSQDTVQSSNENRILLNDIAVNMVKEAPWFGNGPGTFVSFVERNRLYITEFGAPLDAHGFVQKVAGELGILGLITYVALLGWLLLLVYKPMKMRSQYDSTQSKESAKSSEESEAEQEYSSERYLLVTLFAVAAGATFFQLFQTSYFIGLLWLPIGIAVAGARMLVPFREKKI